MLASVVVTILMCPKPVIVDSVKEPFEIDDGVVQELTKWCNRTYPDQPCLIKVERLAVNDFLITCGKVSKEEAVHGS